MNHAAAIAQLAASAEVCEANAPINEAEGNHEQAQLERSNAKSYRSAIESLSAGSEQKLTPPAIGEIWPGQGGIYGGLRQYPEGLCHIIFAAEDVPGRHAYGDYGVEVEAESRTDGRANTEALVAREGKHPAAIAASRYSADGHNDFYLASIGELHHGWQFLPESFATDWYYGSSTQFSAYGAYLMVFEPGWLNYDGKDYGRLVRPVRRFLQ